MITQKIDLYSDSESEVDRGEVLANIVWKGKDYPIYDGENIIGREDDCDIVLDHESISLKHAVLDFEDGVAKLRDLKSKNGTSVESAAGGGTFVKLGPNRRNEVVASGCRIRFGLVDCRLMHVGASSSEKPKSNLKIDCETQFINMGALADDDEDDETSDKEGAHDYGIPDSTSSMTRRASVPEQDTQVNQSLTTAEKAPIQNHSSPINFISGLVGSGRTPTTSGNMDVGIGYGHSPPSDGTEDSPALLLRTASSKPSPAMVVRPLPLPVTSPNGTDVGDETGDETEDEGGAMSQHKDEDDHHLPPPVVPSPAPAAAGLDTTLMADSDDEGSEMSQDLLRAAEDEPGTLSQERDVPSGAPPAGHDSGLARPQFQQEDATQSEHSDGEGGEDEPFNFAQQNPRTAESAAPPAPATGNGDGGRSSSGPTESTVPQHLGSIGDAPGSPFHGIGESAAFFTANTPPQKPTEEEDEAEAGAVAAVEDKKADASASLESLSGLAAAEYTASSNGGVQISSPSARSRSAPPELEDRKEPENEEEEDALERPRSPGAAIQQLLQQSDMRDGARVFNTQGDIVGGTGLTGSPRITSTESSLPADAPSLGFDFAAASSRPVVDVYAVDAGDDDSRMDVDDAEFEAEAEADEQPKPPAKKRQLPRSSSVQTPAAAPSAGKGRRKRVLEDSDDEEKGEVGPVIEEEPTGADGDAGAAKGAQKGWKERNVRARKTRSNDPGDLGVPLPVTTEVPFSPAKQPQSRSAGKRKRFLDTESDEEAEFEAEVEADVETPKADTAVPAPVDDVGDQATSSKVAPKKGRGKAKAEAVPAIDEPAVLDDEPPVDVPAPTKRGRGKGGKAVEEPIPPVEEPAAAVEVAPELAVGSKPAAAAVKKGGRGKGRVDMAAELPPMSAEEDGADAEPVEPAEPAVETKKAAAPAKRGAKKAAADAPAEDTVEPEAAVDDDSVAPSAKAKSAPAKKGGKKTAAVATAAVEPVAEEAAVEAPEEPPAAAVPKKSGGAKKGTKASASEPKADEQQQHQQQTDDAATTAVADPGVRVMFTKVEDGPYLKVLKALPHVSVVQDATVVTHCVTLAELKRTPKLMVALNCGVRYVVTEQWAKDCIKTKSLVAVTPPNAAAKKGKLPKDLDPRVDVELYQQLLASPYIVHDAEKEKLWKFSMAATLAIPRSLPGERRLFEGLCFLVTKGVCGETAPPADELCAIVESGGGTWLTGLEDWHARHAPQGGPNSGPAKATAGKSKKGKSAAAAEEDGAGTVESAASPALVILTHPNVMKKEVNKKITEALAKCEAPGAGVYSMELVFLACLRQRIDFDESRLM